MGTSNQNASFGNAIGGALASAQSNGFVYNFTALDHITTGLASVGVRAYLFLALFEGLLLMPRPSTSNFTCL